MNITSRIIIFCVFDLNIESKSLVLFSLFLFVLQAVLVLGKVSLDSPKWRDVVLGQGGLSALLQQLNENAKLSILRIATWTLGTFCYGKPQPNFDQVDIWVRVLCCFLGQIKLII